MVKALQQLPCFSILRIKFGRFWDGRPVPYGWLANMRSIKKPIPERLTPAQRPGEVLRGGRLEIGVKGNDILSGTDRFHRSAPPLSRFFGYFLAETRKYHSPARCPRCQFRATVFFVSLPDSFCPATFLPFKFQFGGVLR